MTDFRALCAELADSLEEWLSSNSIGGISLDDGTDAELIYRARAAIAQPEPQGPTFDDISELCEEFEFHLDGNGEYNDTLESAEALWEICHAVLARWGNQ